MELIWNAESKIFLLKIIKIKRVIKELKIAKKLK